MEQSATNGLLDAYAPAQIAMRVREVGVTKAAMPVLTMFALAVWLCMGARSVTDKIIAVVFPITGFVVYGFEHSVANMYFLPIGVALAIGGPAPLSVLGALSNLALATMGNVLAGTILVALVY